MNKLGDMDLFVRVVKNQGLAAAGREVGLSPASMSARMNRLEERYGTRLLNRTTRHVSPTETGREFYDACIRILAEVKEVEVQLQTGRESFAGPLRITAPSDVGQQYVEPALTRFIERHPDITAHLHLTDGLVNLAAEGFDLGIRYGLLSDSSLVAKTVASSRRVLCASPDYLKQHGEPATPRDLMDHACLVMVRAMEPLTNWYFERGGSQQTVVIAAARSSNDGAVVRQWALEGHGIAIKSTLDIAKDLSSNRLVTVLDDYAQDFARHGTSRRADLHAVFPSRRHISNHVRAFIDMLSQHFASELPAEV